jgi:hypothetical protein
VLCECEVVVLVFPNVQTRLFAYGTSNLHTLLQRHAEFHGPVETHNNASLEQARGPYLRWPTSRCRTHMAR